jgi:hypothetical protein
MRYVMRNAMAAGCKIGWGQRIGADRIHAEVAAAQVARAADRLAVHKQLVGAKEAHLDGGMRHAAKRRQVGMAAHPVVRLVVRINFRPIPQCVGLPAGFVEIRCGPCDIVAGMPHALLPGDGYGGLRPQRGHCREGRRGNEEKEERLMHARELLQT